MRRVLFSFFLFFFSYGYAGFSPETAIFCLHNCIPIEQLHKDSVIVSYDETNDAIVESIVSCSVTRRTSNTYKVICDKDISFISSPNQVVRVDSAWRAVKDLKAGDRLWCYQNAYAVVQDVQIISQEMDHIEITVLPSHTFFVTSARILAHNHPAIVITAVPLVTSIIPAATKAVGVLGVIGPAFYSLFAKSAGHNIHKNSSNNFSNCSTPPPPEDPRNKTKYKNMKQVFNESPIGEKLKKVTQRTKFRYKGARIYKVVQDVEEWGIKKGDWLYLDTLHYDHLEVFDKSGETVRTILNMDGTQNAMKLKQAGVRSIAECIG